jgi:hypothetical protein
MTRTLDPLSNGKIFSLGAYILLDPVLSSDVH